MDVVSPFFGRDGGHKHEFFLEGISDEVLAVGVLFAVAVATALYFYFFHHEAAQRVHPSLEAGIGEFRRRFFGETNGGMSEEERLRRINAARERTDGTCPICFGPSAFPVLTNCGHLFCCECVIGYWQHSASLIQPVSCAICRAKVTVLLPLDWPVDDSDSLQENNLRLDDYNRRFSEDRPWLDYIRDLPVLIPYALQQLMGYGGLMAMFRLRVAICVLAIIVYVLSPFDIIPESAFGLIGLLDDLFIMIVILIYVSIAVRQFMARRGEAGNHG